MNPDVRVCSVCAWREDCKKRFIRFRSMPFSSVHCPDYTRDVRIKESEIAEKIVEYQVDRWRRIGRRNLDFVITISRQAGAGGSEIARRLAEEFKMDLVGRQLIELVAKSTKMNVKMVELLDERAVSRIDFDDHLHVCRSASFARHLFPPLDPSRGYDRRARLVDHRGPGGQSILPAEKTIRLRFIAPAGVRIRYFVRTQQMDGRRGPTICGKKRMPTDRGSSGSISRPTPTIRRISIWSSTRGKWGSRRPTPSSPR